MPTVLALLRQDPHRASELVPLLEADDPVIAMRAADTLEKFSRAYPASLQPFRRRLLALLPRATQQEVRWHLAQLVPRLTLSLPERRRAFTALESYLGAKSSIVRASTLEALVLLAGTNQPLIAKARQNLESAVARGTPAMKARARRLLRLAC